MSLGLAPGLAHGKPSSPKVTLDQARQREIQIKKWSPAKKEALIAGDMDKLHELGLR